MNPFRPANFGGPGNCDCLVFAIIFCLFVGFHPAAAQETGASPIGRFLLVSSEGLYVVEPNGGSTWFYNPTPYKGQGWVKYDDLIYDGCPLPNGHFLYAAHRYVREIDREKHTVWEYRVEGTTEVKTCVPLRDGNVAVLNSQEQAILELESGTGKVLHRIAVPAKGSDHTRYSLLRRTSKGNYLVALRDEKRFVEVTREGQVLHAWTVPSLPVVAERLADGSTLCSGQFGLKKFDAEGMEIWSFAPADTVGQFPLLITAGFVELPDHGILAVNSDWHYKKEGDNRVQLFAVGGDKKVSWTLQAATFKEWKHSEIDPATKLTEHRCMMVHAMK